MLERRLREVKLCAHVCSQVLRGVEDVGGVQYGGGCPVDYADVEGIEDGIGGYGRMGM